MSCIEDEHLIALRFIFDDSDNKKRNYVLKNKLEDAKQEFIKGKLAETREKSIKLLETYPNNIEAINLLVETNILLNNEEEVFANTNLGMLISKLKSVYTLDDNRDNEIDEINKFTNCQSWSSWAKSIRNAIVYRCKEYDNIKVNKSEILANLQYLDIETVIASLNKDECVGFINNKLDLNNQYIAFRKACCENDFDGAILLCNIPQIKDLLFVCDTRNSIEDKIAHLGSVKGRDASIAIMRIKYFIANLDIKENYDVILDISAKLIAENIYTSLFIPLKKIIDYIDGAGENIRKNICSPILYYVYSYYFKRDKIDDLGIVCEDFFLFNDIERPTRMDIYAYDSMDLVIFFLRNVCNSKVMDMAVWDFKNSQDREQERLGICNILNEIDATNSEEYDKEIREITQRLMINKELTTIEENRIHVNVDGIKEKLIKEYKNDFFRYKFYEDKSYEEWLALIPREEISILRDASKRILKELVFHIRDAFVSSDEYGLDVYLSLNIRHGTLADELRWPINRTMLNAKKDVATGDYTINSNWMKEIDDDDRNIITNAISEFYIETESIISKLKGRYIQIQTEEKKTGGLFDYTLYELDIMSISGYISGVDSFEDFFDYIISYMWSITEENLVNIKQKIKTEILEDYNNAFDVLKAKISTIKSKDKMRELLQKINEAATDMPNVLDKICYWFQRSTESKHNDFDLQFAFDMGLQTIRNIHPEKEFVAIPKVETVSEKIKGYYLKDYDSIFYNLFANIYKYAYSKNGRRIEIRYELKYQNGETYIYLENDYDCSQDISFEIAKIEEQKAAIRSKEYKKRIKGEGGTGIPKICNIIVSDIKNELTINYDFVADDNLFFIEISFWER